MKPPSKLVMAATLFADHYFYLAEPSGAVNNCRRVSTAFLGTAIGITLCSRPHRFLVEMSDPKKPFRRQHPWHSMNTEPKDVHVAVSYQGWVVDFTFRQFDSKSRYPLILRIEDVQKIWSKVKIEKYKD